MKIKKSAGRILLIAILSSVVVLAAGCGKDQISEKDPYVYCLNNDRTGLVKVKYEKKSSSVSENVKEVLKAINDTGESIDYTPVLPSAVRIEGERLEGGIVTLDLSSAYESLPSLEEKIVRAALVESLVRVDGVAGVRINVNGKELTDKNGVPIGLLTDDDYVQGASTALNAYETKTVTLYFADEKGESLVPVKTDVKYNTNNSIEKLIVERLVRGPKKTGANPTVNPQTNLLGVTIKDRICYVNFDSEFLNSIHDVLPEVAVYSVVNSIISDSQATQVQITINGETENTFMEKVDLSKPLSFSSKWIQSESTK